MATYKSSHKGSQIDNAVSVANANLNRGTAETPIYYDSEGFGQAIEKDSTVTASSTKPLTSGGAYTGLETVVDNSDIQYENFNGEFTVVGNVNIVDGVASGFSSSNYLTTTGFTIINNFETQGKFTYREQQAFQNICSFNSASYFILAIFTNYEDILCIDTSANGTQADGIVSSSVTLVDGQTYYYKCNYDGTNVTLYLSSDNINYTQIIQAARTLYSDCSSVTIGTTKMFTSDCFTGSIDLNYFSISVDDKVVYTPYPNPALPPSQNAAKQFIDAEAATKQPNLIGGYGVDVDGATVSLNSDIIREGDNRTELKVDHFEEFGINNNAELLDRMNEAKHSTFDLSKFTVVGSPTITDDGIASGFGSNDSVRLPVIKKEENQKYEIFFEFTTSETLSTQDILKLDSSTTYAYINTDSGGSTLWLIYNDWVNPESAVIGVPMEPSTTYKFVWGWDGSRCYAKHTKNGVRQTDRVVNQSAGSVWNYNFIIGNHVSGHPWLGTIDLKQFAIMIDGVEVFSGNKTGIDVIKPDDYTVVGTPTISADGIASGFSSSNQVKVPNTLPTVTTNDKWSIKYKFTLPQSASGNQTIIRFPYGAWGYVYVNPSVPAIYVQPFVTVIRELSTSDFIWGATYEIENIFTGTNVITNVKRDGVALTSTIAELPSTPVTYELEYMALGWYGDVNNPQAFTGSIDLNALKIYVDGNLVYQPCLKIPYTQTKDGKKIVDSYYRDRVEDEYNQAGYTPYYSIQPLDQGNFTVVGSPTITSDWIASGFSSSNYIDTGKSLTGATWEMYLVFNSGITFDNNNKDRLIGDSSFLGFVLGCLSDGKLAVWLSSTGTSYNIAEMSRSSKVLETNTSYLIKCYFTGTQYKVDVLLNNTWDNYITVNSTLQVYNNAVVIIGTDLNSFDLSTGSIDLNAFKIYVDNKLIYTATPNYTLATVEADDIVDEYLSGSTAYTQRADLFLEQQGTATNGATVSFPKAFADTNYALTIPYTAGTKTTTGFTAAADGDWLAEGGGSSLASSSKNPLEVYEFIIDQSVSSPTGAVSYVGANAGFTPAKMNFTSGTFDWGSWKDTFLYNAFRPCMLKYDGSVDYYLDPNDYTKKLNGSASDVADTSYGGNAMVEFKQIWIKEKIENGKFRISIANSQVDEDYDCFTHMRNDGTLNQCAYISCYTAQSSSSVLRSVSGGSYASQVVRTQITQAQSNGSGWNIQEYSQIRLINYLLILLGRSLNTQSVFGTGNVGSGYGGKELNGYLNTSGLFYGSSDGTTPVKVFGIENYWGLAWTWCNGLVALNGKQSYKMCEGTVDGSSVSSYDVSGIGYINSNIVPSGTYSIKAMTLIPHIGLVPTTLDGTASTYYCDNCFINTEYASCAASWGGHIWEGLGGGAFAVCMNVNDQSSQWGTRISYKAQPSS